MSTGKQTDKQDLELIILQGRKYTCIRIQRFLYKEKCTVENYICFKSCELRNFNCMYIPNKHTREFVLKT